MDVSGAMVVVMVVMMGAMLLAMLGLAWSALRRRLGRRDGDAIVDELRARYARGEIGEEEYRHRIETLGTKD